MRFYYSYKSCFGGYGHGNGLRSSFSFTENQSLIPRISEEGHSQSHNTDIISMKKRTWKTRGRKRSEEAGRTFAGYQKKSERYVAMNGPIFSLERSKGTTHRNLGVLLPFLLDPPKSLEVTASRSTWCIPFVASSFRFAPDNDSPRIQKPRNNLFQTSIIRCYPEREKIWPAETCSGSGRNYRGGYAPAPPSEGTGWTPLGVSISVSFIRWKRTVSLAIEEFTVSFFPRSTR